MLFDGHNIGVVGLTGSGKTTFITSLLDHWSNHDPAKFHVGKNLSLANSLILVWSGDAAANGKRLFQNNRQALEKGDWLTKTLKNDTYCVQLAHTTWTFTRNLIIHDIPGERLADVEMLAHQSLFNWSEAVIHEIKQNDFIDIHAGEFLDIYEDRDRKPSAEWLLELDSAYREFLAKLILACVPFLTPSSVLVDAEGNYVPSDYLVSMSKVQEWVHSKASLGSSQQGFTPLPFAFRHDVLASVPQQNYLTYRNHVVKSSIGALAGCTDVIFLVDLAMVFSQGPSWKNLITTLIQRFVDTVAPRMAWTKRLSQAARIASFGLASPPLERIIFVAAQADRVHESDRNKLMALLKDLARPAVKAAVHHKRLKVEYCVASAVTSTESSKDDDHVLTYYRYSDGQRVAESLQTREIPSQFQNTWKRGDYQFPSPSPRIPKIKGNPPPQFGLDHITNLLLF